VKAVICVMRSGGVYTADHVHRLAKGVSQNITGPYRFICLTDQPDEVLRDGIEVVPLAHDWRGWWSKVEVFAASMSVPTLYIDLDSIVCGPLDGLFRAAPGITMVQDFVLGFGCHNSSVMSWRGDFRPIYRAMCEGADSIPRRYDRRADRRIGDQAFIEDQRRRLRQSSDGFPGTTIASFKKHVRNVPPEDAVIVTFHGMPKPWSSPGWGLNNWRKLKC
jgi:hypothetical protein